MARKYSDEERALIQDFLKSLATVHEGGWDGLMVDAGVPSSTGREWIYGVRALPSALHMLNILRAAGVLTKDYRLPEAASELAAAQRALAKADRLTGLLEQHAQDGKARSGKQR